MQKLDFASRKIATSVTLNQHVIEALNKVADEFGISRSKVVESALLLYFARLKSAGGVG